jgi:hypothetical protein
MTLNAIAQEIYTLSIEERKQLITILVDSLIESASSVKHSLLELEGLGAELWIGVDAQGYVDELRDEWDHRP